MNPIQAAHYVADELLKEKAKLVILGGSAARGKKNPSDLDIAAVFIPKNRLLDENYRRSLVETLSEKVRYEIDLFDFNEKYIDNLIKSYNEAPREVCFSLNFMCLDSVRDQWKGWPLVWILGESAEEKLSPYGCFQKEFMVLRGCDYLNELRNRIKESAR